jgi:hypothetical protein
MTVLTLLKKYAHPCSRCTVFKQLPMQSLSTPIKPWMGYAIFILLTAPASSCSGPTPRQRQQMQLTQRLSHSLERERQFVTMQSNMVRRSLEDRIEDPVHAVKAEHWQPVAAYIGDEAKMASNSIAHLLKELKEKRPNGLFDQSIWSDSLFHVLVRFKYAVLHADKQLLAEFEHTTMPTIPVTQWPNDSSNRAFEKENFRQLSNAEAALIWQYWQKEVALAENKLITYCLHHATGSICGLKLDFAVVNQSHGSLSPGDTLTITAGIGYYSLVANPSITVQGKPVKVTDNAMATYRLKVANRIGKYKVPVKINFTDYVGIKKTQTLYVEYKVR